IVVCYNCKGKGHVSKQCTKPKRKRDDAWFKDKNFVNSEEPNLSTRPTIVEVPKELPKVSMVNSSLKKLKFHLASFDVVVKERTTATAITEGTWGFKHTKACFRMLNNMSSIKWNRMLNNTMLR
nr:hypothetical protein [Tanacetum cinerariifolium]